MAVVPLRMLLVRRGACSNRAASRAVLEGRVAVNGEVVCDPSREVDESSVIALDGLPVVATQWIVVKMHKPAAMLTTLHDPLGRPTVAHLLPSDIPYVAPVGRLDWDSSGLLLLTNDGQLAYQVLNDRDVLAKVYDVEVAGHPDDATFDPIRGGIDLGDVRCLPADVSIVGRSDRRTRLEVILHEGRRRQIRRSLQRVGLRVRALHRRRIGPIDLGSLKPGEVAELSGVELGALRDALGPA